MPIAKAAKQIDRKDLTGPALRTFFRIADARGLKKQKQMRILGLESRSTLQSWKRGAVAAIPKDALERISYVLGIYKGLHILLPKPQMIGCVNRTMRASSAAGRLSSA